MKNRTNSRTPITATILPATSTERFTVEVETANNGSLRIVGARRKVGNQSRRIDVRDFTKRVRTSRVFAN